MFSSENPNSLFSVWERVKRRFSRHFIVFHFYFSVMTKDFFHEIFSLEESFDQRPTEVNLFLKKKKVKVSAEVI